MRSLQGVQGKVSFTVSVSDSTKDIGNIVKEQDIWVCTLVWHIHETTKREESELYKKSK